MIRTTTRPRKDVHDYMRLPDGVRAELIHGELLMSPSPKERHQRIVSNLHFALRRLVQVSKSGRVYDAPLDVHLPSGDIVQPDVIYISDANRHIIQEWIRGVPDLAIEVVSAETPERDRIVKRDLYARNGIREFWLVDGQDQTVEVLQLAGDSYAPFGYFEGDAAVESSVLPNLTLPISEIFA